jgi:leucyl aminopeptidase (aminopeptidase T)
MVGSPELDIDGITPDGERVPILSNEEWQLKS